MHVLVYLCNRLQAGIENRVRNKKKDTLLLILISILDNISCWVSLSNCQNDLLFWGQRKPLPKTPQMIHHDDIAQVAIDNGIS